MSLAKLHFLTFESKKKQKKTKKCIFSEIEKWPNVLSETAIFSKKSTKKSLGGPQDKPPQDPPKTPQNGSQNRHFSGSF
jgi:predicted P-loop ATPase